MSVEINVWGLEDRGLGGDSLYVVGEDIALVWRAGGKGQWAGVNKDRIVSKMPPKLYLKSITGTSISVNWNNLWCESVRSFGKSSNVNKEPLQLQAKGGE